MQVGGFLARYDFFLIQFITVDLHISLLKLKTKSHQYVTIQTNDVIVSCYVYIIV